MTARIVNLHTPIPTKSAPAPRPFTHIRDKAFIGSNSSLVAPVEVGIGATLGAGTVLTRNAPDGQLTLSRSPQVSIERWQRPRKKPAEPASD